MPMNERIGYDDVNYLANYSPNLEPYANAHINNLASCVAQSSSQIDERWISSNTHNSASSFTINSSRINKNSARSMKAIAYDSAKHNFF
jgi:hypothetical protein